MIATAFTQLLWRDVWVTLRDWKTFFAMTFLQPIFFLFVFGRILPTLGQTSEGYGALFLPGIIGLTNLLTAMQAVALPLTIEFGYTKEIEDRLLSPLPVWLVAIQKMVFAALRGLFAGLMIIPLGRIILGSGFSINLDHLGLLAANSLLSTFGGAALGLVMGTIFQPAQVGLMFSLILTPLLFTGCVYYPWAMLNRIRWFQVITCFSPLTYASEGYRAALVPQIQHMPILLIIGGQVFFLSIFGYFGVRGFLRKAID